MKATIEDHASRFILENDEQSADIFFKVPGTWWSRLYEYIWASKFAGENDTVLDVACGLGHQFKFHLAIKVKKVFACDNNPNINSMDAILADVKKILLNDENAFNSLDYSVINSVEFAMCDMTDMPYSDKSFDKLFCISVFEHLTEEMQLKSLKSFSRVLKDDGLIVMTMDYPDVNLEKMVEFIKEANLKFYADTNFDKPHNALKTEYWGTPLNCFRMVLCKENGGI